VLLLPANVMAGRVPGAARLGSLPLSDGLFMLVGGRGAVSFCMDGVMLFEIELRAPIGVGMLLFPIPEFIPPLNPTALGLPLRLPAPPNESKVCPVETPAGAPGTLLPAPGPFCATLLCGLSFQPGGVGVRLATPKPRSAPPFMYACFFCPQQLHPVRKMPTLNKPTNPAKGFLPIGLSSPV